MRLEDYGFRFMIVSWRNPYAPHIIKLPFSQKTFLDLLDARHSFRIAHNGDDLLEGMFYFSKRSEKIKLSSDYIFFSKRYSVNNLSWACLKKLAFQMSGRKRKVRKLYSHFIGEV